MARLGFGLMRLPLADGNGQGCINQALVNRMVDYSLKNGCSYFDTAYMYHDGASETSARAALAERHARNAFSLADKMPTRLVQSSADYDGFFREQLERCGVDFFDYYLLHNLGAKTYAGTLRHGGFAFMQKLRKEGRAKHIGFSFHDTPELLDEILRGHPEMEFVQLQINYIDWEDGGVQSRACYETARKHGKPVVVMEPVKGGALAAVPPEADRLLTRVRPGMSAASWALRFSASLDGISIVLSGMSNFEQMLDNIGNMRNFLPLTKEERETLEAVKAILRENNAIPCTACRYCVDGCPRNIPIPQYFALYNNQKQFGLTYNMTVYYANLAEKYTKASACIACGQCGESCPQHIDVAARMQEVAGVFEPRNAVAP
jgi:predicted aldo/keto reductase-like oxidoreductase